MGTTSQERHDQEHERRFLVTDLSILEGSNSEEIEQGYLWADGGYAIRARRTQAKDENGTVHDAPAFLTAKGPRKGSVRWEVEVDIALDRAADLIDLARHKIQKTRHGVISENNAWVVDVFHGANEGLVIAEFEGTAAEVAAVKKPWWCGAEVTQDKRYNNENLAEHPWPEWPENR